MMNALSIYCGLIKVTSELSSLAQLYLSHSYVSQESKHFPGSSGSGYLTEMQSGFAPELQFFSGWTGGGFASTNDFHTSQYGSLPHQCEHTKRARQSVNKMEVSFL